MGVPAFFRWIRDKYTKCIQNVLEEEEVEHNGVKIPIDFSQPNPNKIEFDNLYLDMNGIIHPCVHPEDVSAPETEEGKYRAIFLYIDRIVAAVRPRKLLYMAIDGVAPRAKMNQQRSRRFKAALEIKERDDVEEELREKMRAKGQAPPPKAKPTFDHNVITPGTRFMDRLALFLRYFIHERMNTHPAWRNLRVILSDASVPGEGEHKIMEFIRQQRAHSGYNPNIRHILHGLDADLIMLGLATHEVHFTILREEVLPPKGQGSRACFTCGQEGHRADQCQGLPRERTDEKRKSSKVISAVGGDALNGEVIEISRKPLQFLHLSILREYLVMEFSPLAYVLPFQFDLERIIDDFVFMCFFVGNDFLPHLPSMDIREGALDLLILLYKRLLPTMDGYLTHDGTLTMKRVDILLSKVGAVEDEIFRRRRKKEEKDLIFEAQRKAEREKEKEQVRSLSPVAFGKDETNVLSESFTSLSGGRMRHEPSEHQRAVLELLGDISKRKKPLPPPRFPAQPSLSAMIESAPPTFIAPATAENKSAAAAMRSQLGGGKKRERGEDLISGSSISSNIDNSIIIKNAIRDSSEVISIVSDEISVVSEPGIIDSSIADDFEQKKRKIRDSVITTSLSSSSTFSNDFPADEVSGVSASEDVHIDEQDTLAEIDGDDEDEVLMSSRNARGVLKDAVGAALEAFKIYDDVKDEVRLGDQGWKERYYNSKFGRSDAAFKRSVMRSYVEGLVWVFRYYYQGVASWKWYYPFHYAPFASDLVDLHSLGTISFELGRPFRPLDQLMAVLPALSSHALPAACAKLMSSTKEKNAIDGSLNNTTNGNGFVSPVADFYPETFEQDPNGKKQSWLWVVLLPFIDEKRLVAAIDSVANTFSADERRRNEFGNEVLFVHSSTALGDILSLLAPTAEDVRSLEQSTSGRPRLAAVADSELVQPIVDDKLPASVISLGRNEEGKPVGEGEKVDAQLQREERAVVSNDVSSSILRHESARAISSSASLFSPAISPAVTEALALAQSEGEVISLRPDMGDPEHKGFTARIVRVARALKHGCAASLGGVLPSPFPLILPAVTNVRVVQVGFLPPMRAVHSCKLLPGSQPPQNCLQPSDDASGKVPRLSRGHNIVDLAYSIGSIDRNDSEGGGGRHGGQNISGGGRISQFLAQANHNQYQRQFLGNQLQYQQPQQNHHFQQQHQQYNHHQLQQHQQQHSYHPTVASAANQHGMMFSQAPQFQAPFMHVGSALTGGLQLQMAYNQGSYMQQQYQPQQPTMAPTMVMTPSGPMMMMVPSLTSNPPSHFGPPGYQSLGMFPSTGISGGGRGRGTGQTTSASQRGGFISGGGFTPSSSSNTTRYSFKR
jgi:5'-3' exoribonuclease 2